MAQLKELWINLRAKGSGLIMLENVKNLISSHLDVVFVLIFTILLFLTVKVSVK